MCEEVCVLGDRDAAWYTTQYQECTHLGLVKSSCKGVVGVLHAPNVHPKGYFSYAVQGEAVENIEHVQGGALLSSFLKDGLQFLPALHKSLHYIPLEGPLTKHVRKELALLLPVGAIRSEYPRPQQVR